MHQDEDSDDYGPVIAPASSVAEAIKLRTEEHLRKERTAVSSKPIVMRVEYAFCPNLTIIDTPGFVLKVYFFPYCMVPFFPHLILSR